MTLDYGECFRCKRLMPINKLVQIRYYKGHLIIGKHHHKLICQSCKEAANQTFEDVENGSRER